MTGEQWLSMIGRRDLTDEEWTARNYGELSMSEAEWASCPSPAVVFRHAWFKLSARKKQLYLCGGCSRMKHLYYEPSQFKNLEVAERDADGLASDEEVRWAAYAAEGCAFGYHYEREFWDGVTVDREEGIAELIAAGILDGPAWSQGEWIVDWELVERTDTALKLLERCFLVASADILSPFLVSELEAPNWPGRWLSDCVFGNPFRPVVADPAWLTPTAVAIASSIYQNRAFDRLPILADALEEAGCTHADVLLHCRTPGEHVRGCWVVDLVLGKL